MFYDVSLNGRNDENFKTEFHFFGSITEELTGITVIEFIIVGVRVWYSYIIYELRGCLSLFDTLCRS